MDAYGYEEQAEQQQMMRQLHPKMRVFYSTRRDLSPSLGDVPAFWRDCVTWPGYKAVLREYLRSLDRAERGAPADGPAAAATPAHDARASAGEPVAHLRPSITAADAPVERVTPSPSPAAVPATTEQAPAVPLPRKRRKWADADDVAAPSAEAAGAAKRRNRWTRNTELTLDNQLPMILPSSRLRTRFGQRILPAATTLVPPGITPVQEALFLYRIRVEEVGVKLMVLPAELKQREADPSRSPSPPPEYDSTGKRTNSREQRMRKKLEDKRNTLLEMIMDLNPALCGSHGPKFSRKLYIPWREFPAYNFMGMVIGPRGSTQKKLERETNCKISVRGRGSGKDGKAGLDAGGSSSGGGGSSSGGGGDASMSFGQRKRHADEDDEMHVNITGERLAEVRAAEVLVADLLKPIEDDNNEWKRLQLAQLATINGTMRDMSAPCHVCGEPGHRQYEVSVCLKSRL